MSIGLVCSITMKRNIRFPSSPCLSANSDKEMGKLPEGDLGSSTVCTWPGLKSMICYVMLGATIELTFNYVKNSQIMTFDWGGGQSGSILEVADRTLRVYSPSFKMVQPFN